MQAIKAAIPNSFTYALPKLQSYLKNETIRKIGILLVPALALQAAGIAAPVTLALSTVGVTLISVFAVQQAVCKMTNPDKAALVIKTALIVTAIFLAGNAMGWLGHATFLLLDGLMAESMGVMLRQLLCCSILVEAYSLTVKAALSVFEKGWSYPAVKIRDYMRAIKLWECPKPDSLLDAPCLFSQFAFPDYAYSNALWKRMPWNIRASTFTLATDKIIQGYLQRKLQEITEALNFYDYARTQAEKRRVRNTISQPLSKYVLTLPIVSDSKILIYNISNFLDTIPKITHITDTDLYMAPLAVNERVREMMYLNYFHQISKVQIPRFQASLNEIEVNIEANFEKAKSQFCAFDQATIRELLLITKRMALAFPADKQFTKMKDQLQKLLLSANALEIKLRPKISKQAPVALDLTESVWYTLIQNVGKKGTDKKTLQEVKDLQDRFEKHLQASTPNEIDSQMEKLGLGTLQALLDKGIVTEDELKNEPETVQWKVFEYIRK